MAGMTAIVPYYDPFDDLLSIVQIPIWDENPIPELLWNQEYGYPYPIIPQRDCDLSFDDSMIDAKSPFVDPVLQGSCNDQCSETGLSEIFTEIDSQTNNGSFADPQGCPDFNGIPFMCSSCQVLREITHTNDPLWDFYEALGVGFRGGGTLDFDNLFQLYPTNSGDGTCTQISQQDLPNQNQAEGNGVRHPKIPLSAQRERTGKLKLRDFAGYLHFPIEEAARKMNICPTVMKKICRRYGLSRWPYRKIRSIQRKISKKTKSLSANDVEERVRAHADIQNLEQELAKIFEAFFD